jgi:hypothetical protein
MAYVNWVQAGVVETNNSLLRRIHWERLGLLAVNAALWAVIYGIFS